MMRFEMVEIISCIVQFIRSIATDGTSTPERDPGIGGRLQRGTHNLSTFLTLPEKLDISGTFPRSC